MDGCVVIIEVIVNDFDAFTKSFNKLTIDKKISLFILVISSELSDQVHQVDLIVKDARCKMQDECIMTTIDVDGLSETFAMRLNKISRCSIFETREGWKNSYEKRGEKDYFKKFQIGKIFTLKQIMVHVSIFLINETIQNSLYHHLKKQHNYGILALPMWKELKLCNSRYHDSEFLVCRLYRKVGSTIYVVAKSFEIDEIPKHSVSLILALHICYIVIQCLLKKMCKSSEKVTTDRKS
ncbi:unnamed protein product [Brugia timori]|uniref:Reverse transcriptase domain-containing protein n=1 Tax=Brugia timori TaxID=42155 RepID=A0A0R3QNQ2_9BILA|nr:unnamed protein product [Brugia timori]